MTYRFDAPFYVNTRFNYFCEGCKQAELEIETEKCYSYDDVLQTAYTLTCTHYDHCKRLVHRLRYEKETDNAD